jgi:hypothetical protein
LPFRFRTRFLFCCPLCERRRAFATVHQHRGFRMLSELILAEIEAGEGESLARAARRFPSARQGKAVTLSCLLRWVTSGVFGPDGRRVKLEAARLAGRWITTPGAIRRFVAAQTPRLCGEAPTPRTPARRQRASDQAAKELDRIGI